MGSSQVTLEAPENPAQAYSPARGSQPRIGNRSRMTWLDALKGIGIIAVVWGHVVGWPEARFAYLWHMPLFFFLAGYVFKPDPNLPRFLKDKAFRLLVPYTLFLVLLSCVEIPTLIRSNSFGDWLRFLATHVSGGKSIYGWFAAFWFITCLFLSQQLVNLGIARYSRNEMRWLALASLMSSYINEWLLPWLWLPWAAHICLFAAPLIYAGFEFRQANAIASSKVTAPAISVTLAIVAFLLVWKNVIAYPDLKIMQYGTPVVTVFFSLCVVVALIVLSQRWMSQGAVANVLAYIGRASLVIMFLHMVVKETAMAQFGIANHLVLVAIGVLLPIIAFALLDRSRITRSLFLGVPSSPSASASELK